jgi:hypothetical protein
MWHARPRVTDRRGRMRLPAPSSAQAGSARSVPTTRAIKGSDERRRDHCLRWPHHIVRAQYVKLRERYRSAVKRPLRALETASHSLRKLFWLSLLPLLRADHYLSLPDSFFANDVRAIDEDCDEPD